MSIGYAKGPINKDRSSIFSGRVSSLSPVARLARIRIDFENAKFLNKKDRVEFWNETYPDQKCLAYVVGKSNRYLLLKVPNYKLCITNVHMTVGSYLHMYSIDLEEHLSVAKDLVKILLKKRLALRSRLMRYEKEVESFVEKMDAVNKRYEVLRQKMEIEWKKELTALEEDKTTSYMNYKNTQARLGELEHKMQKYRVQDQNLVEDRWSLDSKLYFKK